MNSLPAYLFVYGTLRPGFDNPAATQLRQHSQYTGEGQFPGLLYDTGTYPGAVYQPDSASQVHGSVYRLPVEAESLLAALDEYEGIGTSSLPGQPDEYVRQLIPVDCAGLPLICWVYLFNWPPDPTHLIPSGDYRQHVNR